MPHRSPPPAEPSKATAEAGREDLAARTPDGPQNWRQMDRHQEQHRCQEQHRDEKQNWWQRLSRRMLPPPEAPLSWPDQVDQLNRQLAVLEAARADLEAGWVQGGWWEVTSADGGRRLIGGLESGLGPGLGRGFKAGLAAGLEADHAAAAGSQTGRVSGVCLVGALARAGHGMGDASGGSSGSQDSHDSPVTGPAIDAVYDALWASRGQPATVPGESGLLPPVPSPQVRLARVRTLTQWNDRPGRTRAEVLAVVDRAISATILALAAAPNPQAPQHPRAPRPRAPHAQAP